MNDATSIVIITQDNIDVVSKTYKKLNKLAKRHALINKILWIDNASRDGTAQEIISLIKESNPSQRNQLIYTEIEKDIKTLIQQAIKESPTPNILFLEPEFYTSFRCIMNQIKLLRRAQAILPYRQELVKDKRDLLLKMSIFDVDNPNKAFKTATLRMIEVPDKKEFWESVIFHIQKTGIRRTTIKSVMNYEENRFQGR